MSTVDFLPLADDPCFLDSLVDSECMELSDLLGDIFTDEVPAPVAVSSPSPSPTLLEQATHVVSPVSSCSVNTVIAFDDVPAFSLSAPDITTSSGVLPPPVAHRVSPVPSFEDISSMMVQQEQEQNTRAPQQEVVA